MPKIQRQPATPPQSISGIATRGMAWMTVNSIVSKAIGVLQLLIVMHLVPVVEVGLGYTAFIIAAAANVLSYLGLEDVLTTRQAHFRKLATPAFWMSIACAVVTMLVMLITAPLFEVAHHYILSHTVQHFHIVARTVSSTAEEPTTSGSKVIGLVLLLMLNTLLNASCVVPFARAKIDLRFKAAAGISFASNMLFAGSTVFMAWRGYGAYAIIAPRVITNAFIAVSYWYLGFTPIHLSPQFRLWKHLISAGAFTFATRAAGQLTSNGDNMTVGLMYPSEVLGIYGLAFNLSTQANQLFIMNLNNVLFPALCKLQSDVQRQARAMLRGVHLMAAVAVPLCFLQAALAEPTIHIFFRLRNHPTTWYPAIPVLQALSIGAAFSALGWPSGALLPAQGRFKTHMILAWITLAVFFALVIPGAVFGQALGVGIAVAIWYAIYAATALYVAIRPAGMGWREIIANIRMPLLSATVAVGFGTLAGQLLPMAHATHMYDWAATAVITLVSAAVYLPLLRQFDRPVWIDIVARFKALRSRKSFPITSEESASAKTLTGSV
jgi:O-antigen/teichoic acid export membrane protein